MVKYYDWTKGQGHCRKWLASYLLGWWFFLCVYMPRRINFDPINWVESSESVAGHWQPKNEWCSSDEWPPRLGQKTSDYQCCCEVDLWMILIHHSKKTQMALKKNAGMCVGKYSNEGALLADWYYSLAWWFISFNSSGIPRKCGVSILFCLLLYGRWNIKRAACRPPVGISSVSSCRVSWAVQSYPPLHLSTFR